MFDAIAPRYELVNTLMTFGLDKRWRRRAVHDLRLARDSVVLDVAAGTGDFYRELERQGLRPVACDLSYNMLRTARDVVERVQADASALPFRWASVDGATCGYALRNFTDLEKTFSEMARVLRPGGRLSLLEVAEPSSGIWRSGFRFWFRSRRATHWVAGLRPRRLSLPAGLDRVPPHRRGDRDHVESRGFSAVNHRRIMGGLSQQFVATRSA